MVFLPSVSDISIANRGGGWDGWQDGTGWGGVGGGKKPWLGHLWSSHEAHTIAHAALVGQGGRGSNPKSPPPT